MRFQNVGHPLVGIVYERCVDPSAVLLRQHGPDPELAWTRCRHAAGTLSSRLTTSRRQSFANDLTRPQLIAVTDNINQSKGDQDPSAWQPSITSYRCTHAKMWIAVKSYWALTLQARRRRPCRQ
ncbi:hypothetical protein [Actinoplanes sp. NPDC049599]|uniref:hypothetical protein n=1 Tax=Actinoplanes sp. NPDC049599 TaxID=3363903 RepID=UPI0037BDA1FA